MTLYAPHYSSSSIRQNSFERNCYSCTEDALGVKAKSYSLEPEWLSAVRSRLNTSRFRRSKKYVESKVLNETESPSVNQAASLYDALQQIRRKSSCSESESALNSAHSVPSGLRQVQSLDFFLSTYQRDASHPFFLPNKPVSDDISDDSHIVQETSRESIFFSCSPQSSNERQTKKKLVRTRRTRPNVEEAYKTVQRPVSKVVSSNSPISSESVETGTVVLSNSKQTPRLSRNAPRATRSRQSRGTDKPVIETSTRKKAAAKNDSVSSARSIESSPVNLSSQSNVNLPKDDWTAREVERLLSSQYMLPTCEPNYWDRIALIVNPDGKYSGLECSKKLMEIHEERFKKKFSRKKKVIKEMQIPLKGNTRSWKMNQYIRSRLVKTTQPDLLKQCIHHDTYLQNFLKEESVALSDLQVEDDLHLSGNGLLNANELNKLNSLHTGLTPRGRNNSGKFQKKKEKDEEDILEEGTCNTRNSVEEASMDLLEIPAQSLERHWMIEKHRKKYSTLKKKQQQSATRPSSHVSVTSSAMGVSQQKIPPPEKHIHRLLTSVIKVQEKKLSDRTRREEYQAIKEVYDSQPNDVYLQDDLKLTRWVESEDDENNLEEDYDEYEGKSDYISDLVY